MREHETPSEEAPARKHQRGRCAEEEDSRMRDRARLQADDERVANDGIGELVDQPARRRVGKDRDDRQQQEREREQRCGEVGEGERRQSHARPATGSLTTSSSA